MKGQTGSVENQLCCFKNMPLKSFIAFHWGFKKAKAWMSLVLASRCAFNSGYMFRTAVLQSIHRRVNNLQWKSWWCQKGYLTCFWLLTQLLITSECTKLYFQRKLLSIPVWSFYDILIWFDLYKWICLLKIYLWVKMQMGGISNFWKEHLIP